MGISYHHLFISGRPLGRTVLCFSVSNFSAAKRRGQFLHESGEIWGVASALASDARVPAADFRPWALVPVLEVVCSFPLGQSDVDRLLVIGRVHGDRRSLSIFLDGRSTAQLDFLPPPKTTRLCARPES